MSPSPTIHNTNTSVLQKDATDLLKKLIAIPSFSKEEDKTALLLTQFFADKNIKVNTLKNNIWVANLHFDVSKPSILLNSHHDTVKPNKGYTNEPFSSIEKEGKLYGLGANDAGGSLVSLIACFLHFYAMPNLAYNLIFLASAEEEISGPDGIELAIPQIPKIAFGIVGEPTKMEMAIAERGLLVLDVTSTGKAGHAAREEGENVSDLLGKVKMSVTVIETDNKQHNVLPSTCKMVVDVRVNELYSFEEILKTIQENVKGEVSPRSLRMRSTSIGLDHVLVKAGKDLGKGHYGSVTTSDKALMPFPTLKMGPGDSARSHIADEFIYIKEIEEGIVDYIQLLEKIV
jgi:acetylornithine deacetylase